MLRSTLVLTLAVVLGGCGTLRGAASTVGEVRAAVPREAPTLSSGEASALRAGDSAFAGRLLATVAPGASGNVVVSPFSISEALAMTLGGARGQTARQIAGALELRLSGPRLHAALDALDRELASIAGLRSAGALYGQRGFAFRRAFLELLARYYGAGMHTVDFQHATE